MEIGGKEVEVRLGSKIHPGGGCSHEIMRHFLLGRITMTDLDEILKCRDLTGTPKVRVRGVTAYGCKS